MNDDYDDYDYDANMYLPTHFVTCFEKSQLAKYRQAIEKYAEKHPHHGLVIDESGSWNGSKDPALLCYDRGDLGEFWEIFGS